MKNRARRLALLSLHDHLRVQRHAIVKVDRVDVAHADAARGHRAADLLGLVGAVDAVERVLVAVIEVERARAERVVRAAVEGATPKRTPTSRVRMPPSAAATTRSRISSEYGLAIPAGLFPASRLDHKSAET